MPIAKIHVLEGRYDEHRLSNVSKAVQDRLDTPRGCYGLSGCRDIAWSIVVQASRLRLEDVSGTPAPQTQAEQLIR